MTRWGEGKTPNERLKDHRAKKRAEDEKGYVAKETKKRRERRARQREREQEAKEDPNLAAFRMILEAHSSDRKGIQKSNMSTMVSLTKTMNKSGATERKGLLRTILKLGSETSKAKRKQLPRQDPVLESNIAPEQTSEASSRPEESPHQDPVLESDIAPEQTSEALSLAESPRQDPASKSNNAPEQTSEALSRALAVPTSEPVPPHDPPSLSREWIECFDHDSKNPYYFIPRYGIATWVRPQVMDGNESTAAVRLQLSRLPAEERNWGGVGHTAIVS